MKVAASKFYCSNKRVRRVFAKVGLCCSTHLSPLYSWAVATSAGTVAKLPETAILSLKYLLKELSADSFLVSAHRPIQFSTDQFRTDAKCTDDAVVIAGWECSGPKRRWFALTIREDSAPYLFKPGKGAQWASTSAELLASVTALFLFGWPETSSSRRTIPISLNAGTDNQSNEALSKKEGHHALAPHAVEHAGFGSSLCGTLAAQPGVEAEG